MAKSRTYADKISASSVMVSGLKSNTEVMSKRGIGDDFITSLETTLQEAVELNNRQEELKGRLREQTSKLNLKMDSLNEMFSESKTIVKLEFDKEAWIKFGVEDKR